MKHLIVLLVLISCRSEVEQSSASRVSLVKKKESKDSVDQYFENSKEEFSNKLKDNFEDLKKEDDESCASEEEIQKKLINTKKAFKLQGQKDEGCSVE